MVKYDSNKNVIVRSKIEKKTEPRNEKITDKNTIKQKIQNKNMNTVDNIDKSSLQKPFLKWVGGKTQIIEKVMSKFPKEMNNYHEIFLGGGSVLFALLSLQKQNLITVKNKIYVYDVNKRLINVYKHIQNNSEELYKFVEIYIGEYDKIEGDVINRKPKNIEEAKSSKESYYYWVREKFRNIDVDTIEASAIFMFINKTCFRGMYREGPNGYNIPYGHYKKTPTVITKSTLDTIKELIKDVEFVHSDYRVSIKNAKKGDFVYLDPPYAPKDEKSFVGYVAGGFNLEMHEKLFDEIKKMDGIKFAMSNAKVDLVMKKFKDFNCEYIVARRAINSKNPGATAKEVIIHN
tara:strand:- start:905 stop:1945 length:1041 start_codon:yes stop_codon:yes gene_type:complete